MNPRLAAAIARAFDKPADSIRADAGPDTIAEWDSVGHITLVSEVEAEFGCRLNTDEILGIRTAADLERLLANKGLLPAS